MVSVKDSSARPFAQVSEIPADVGQLVAKLLEKLHHLGGLGDLAALGKQLLVGALESETAASDEEMYLSQGLKVFRSVHPVAFRITDRLQQLRERLGPEADERHVLVQSRCNFTY